MTSKEAETPVRILIINPNTSTHMTEALKPVVESLGYPSIEYTFFTSPPSHPTTNRPGISSINSPSDAHASAEICLPALIPLLPFHDAFLVACYSQHPLVPLLKAECVELTRSATRGTDGHGARKYVTGIFEASVLASLGLIFDDEGFGIVSTGKIWEEALGEATRAFLGANEAGQEVQGRYAGCETTGLNASELHELPAEEVRGKMMEATKKLLKRGKVKAVCLGCAGMVGLEQAVRTACIEELGDEKGKEVCIVDGVKAGVGTLYGLARGGF